MPGQCTLVCYNSGFWIPEEILSRILAASAAQQALGALPVLPPQPQPLTAMGPMDPMVQNQGQMAYYQAPAAAYDYYPVDPALQHQPDMQGYDMPAPAFEDLMVAPFAAPDPAQYYADVPAYQLAPPQPPSSFGSYESQQPPPLSFSFDMDYEFVDLPITPPEPDYSTILGPEKMVAIQKGAEEAHAKLAAVRAAQNVVGNGGVAASVEEWRIDSKNVAQGSSAQESFAHVDSVQVSAAQESVPQVMQESYADYFGAGDGLEVPELFGGVEIAPLGDQFELSPEDPLYSAVMEMNL
ncbi:hypothetical protein H2199_002659 [Coniosporium tulheliwenetii]|nr:hypothetical protein H2199_002659 [Cladosporium sp. JES 115]